MNDATVTKNHLSFQIRNIERNTLATLGPLFGRCTENLLYLIYTYTLRRLGGNPQDDKFELAASIMPTLDHTQVETIVRILNVFKHFPALSILSKIKSSFFSFINRELDV